MPATYTPTTPVQLAAAYRRAVRTGNRAAARRYRAALRNGMRGSTYATATAYGPAHHHLQTVRCNGQRTLSQRGYTMGNTTTTQGQAVSAVLAFANTNAGKALGACTGAALTRAAVATGKVPGYPASWANLPRSAGNGGAAMHSLGRAVRQQWRTAGMGARQAGHGTYATATAAQGKAATTAGTLAVAHRKAQQAAKQAAKQGKQQAATTATTGTPAS